MITSRRQSHAPKSDHAESTATTCTNPLTALTYIPEWQGTMCMREQTVVHQQHMPELQDVCACMAGISRTVHSDTCLAWQDVCAYMLVMKSLTILCMATNA